MPAGCGQYCGFADLAAEMIAEAALLSKLRQPQRRNESTALGQAQIEQITRLLVRGTLSVGEATQRFIEHNRRANLAAHLRQCVDGGMRHRLLDGADAEWLQFTNVRNNVFGM